MMVKAKNSPGNLMARVNFPLYAVKVITERHFLVAGGGGQAKTGISNTLEVYELIYDKELDTCRAVRVTHFDTGSRAIMSSAIFPHGNRFIFASGGMDGLCQLYLMRFTVNNGEKKMNGDLKSYRDRSLSGGNLRRRRTSSTSSTGKDPELKEGKINNQTAQSKGDRQRQPSGSKKDRHVKFDEKLYQNGSAVHEEQASPTIGFDIIPMKSFQADFKNGRNEEPFLKVVRYCPSKNEFVTGGADGHIRKWKFPDLVKLLDIPAHNDEVDDLDINPTGTHIVTVSRDGHGYVWNYKTFTKFCDLEYEFPIMKKCTKPVKYNIRGCRFGIIENNPANFAMFTIMNPVVRQKPPNKSYLVKWNGIKYAMEKNVETGEEVLSCMSISEDGRFVGLGTLSGTVYIYIAFSLQRAYHMPRAHNIFLTGVEFLKSCPETQMLTGNKDASLLSISVDNHIVIHHVDKQATAGLLGSTMFFMCFMLLIYFLMDFLGL